MIQATSLADQVYEFVAAEILSGKRVRGSALTELQLSGALKVSRTPIREALRRLAADGLVEIRTNCGAVVRCFDAAQVAQIYDIREALECKAVELACGRITRKELDALRARMNGLGDPADARQRKSWNRLDATLHDLIAERCGNPMLAREIGRFRDLLSLLRDRLSMTPGTVKLAWQQHEKILSALKRKDAIRAQAGMRAHIRTFAELHIKMVADLEGEKS